MSELDANDDSQTSSLHATFAQREAIQAVELRLTCRLCHNIVTHPVSLGCGHFFCQPCIENHADNNWNCPECDMSVSMTRSNGKHFFQVDPQLQTMVSSLEDIKSALRLAPEQWWTYKVETMSTTTTERLGRGLATEASVNLDKPPMDADSEDEDDDGSDNIMFQTASY
jgi:hypothetical protein